MKKFLFFILFFSQFSFSQKLKKADKELLNNLKAEISFLADDKLEGRRTGTNGERLAYIYLADQFKGIGLAAKGDSGTYIQPFNIDDGKQINSTTHFIVNGNDLNIIKDFFPLQFSANASLEATPVMAFQEKNMPWFWDLKEVIEKNRDNPHFDLNESIRMKANDVAQKGGTALLVYNTSSAQDEIKFEEKERLETAKIPVVYITPDARKRFFQDSSAALDIKLKVVTEDKNRTGHNVVGYLNNGAANTIIIGAHYDHLGLGEDHNSLWTGAAEIHNGADDNASGTAAVIELAKMLKKHNYKNNNYLFICFSGEEQGLFGSKYFTEHPAIDLSKVNYMINLDMIGRLNDSTHKLIIGGFGTSPSWGNLLSTNEKTLTIKFDSSGIGPSDHTSFYLKNIPVLFFFTGVHSDYHKPGDDVDKINFIGEVYVIKYIYKIIEETNQTEKIPFIKTSEAQSRYAPKFTVTLGIMPDYAFTGKGVRADAIVDGKIAEKAGIKAGDVITALDENKFYDIYSYMDVLSKYKTGDAAKVKVLRDGKELQFDIIF